MDAEAKLEDLRAVSQHVLATTKRLELLEHEKRRTDPGSERFRAISDQIESLADEIRAVSHAETGLARDLAGHAGLPPVVETERGA